MTALAEQPGTPVKLARQARIVLLLAQGEVGSEIARRLGTTPQTVCTWRMRFMRQRLASLQVQPTSPSHRTLPPQAPLQPVTLQHIADLVRVHKSTVHRILTRGGEDASELAQRVRVVARDLGYRPEANHAARQLSQRRFLRPDERRQILFYLPTGTFHSPFFLRQFTAAMDVLAGTRYDVLVRLSDEIAQRQLPTAIERGEVAAVVTTDTPDWLVVEQRLLDRLHPSLRPPLIGLLTAAPGTWSIDVDFAAAGRRTIAHLLALGHRSIIAIEERAAYSAGLRAGLSEAGLDPERHLLAKHKSAGRGDMDERMAETLETLLAVRPDATALVTANDPMALAAIRQLTRLGRRVPIDMSVVGFDDTDPLPGADGRNLLTSVSLPLEEVGRNAARMAMEPGPAPRTVLLPSFLQVRETTVPPPRR